MNPMWHFPFMILASFVLFFIVLRLVLSAEEFSQKKKTIFYLSLVVIIMGMLIGKYGAQWGFRWWIYYPIPMLMNLFLPPYFLKMNVKKTVAYLIFSFLSAPLIHVLFSLLLGWTEYMPFWIVG